jgi:hypothetical protein
MRDDAEAGAKVGSDHSGSDDLISVIPLGREMPGGFVQFDVPDVGEAIALAERFRAAGGYRYFRGQCDARWKVNSSLAREDAAGRLRASKEIDAFAEWVRGAEKLVPYLDDDDKIIAAAQHHQVTQTNFIDFSTCPVVAGWFATEGGVEGQYGAIYLVNPDEVGGIFEAVTRSGPVVRFLQVDVPNLWRLQAQSGLFLEAQCDIAWIWPLDRIVFAQTGAAPALERHRIYPDRRSHLEQMIENYRVQRTRQIALQDLIETTGVLSVNLDHPLGDRLPALASTALGRQWSAGPDERWATIDIESMPPPWSSERIRANPSDLADLVVMRRSSADLLKVDPNFPRRNGTAQAAVDCLWEGLRPHPYSAKQIATSLSSLMRLLDIFGDYPLDNGRSHESVAAQLMTYPIEIEMGIAGGGATRAFVGSFELWGALSREARVRLGIETSIDESALLGILGQFYGATLDLFDPHALVDLFASSIVPWQVATKRSLLCFSPVHLKTLGRP